MDLSDVSHWKQLLPAAATGKEAHESRVCGLENQNKELQEAKKLFRTERNCNIGSSPQATPFTLHIDFDPLLR